MYTHVHTHSHARTHTHTHIYIYIYTYHICSSLYISDSEVPVVLELWGMRTTPSLPLLPGPFWP